MVNRTNSVLRLSAQINKVLQPGSGHKLPETDLSLKLQQHKQQLGRYYYVFIIQYHTGARISEVLNIETSDINERGQILLKGLKKSSNRLIDVNEVREYMLKAVANDYKPFQQCNRFSAYRLLNSIGIGKTKAGRKVASVTHVFRDNYVKSLRELNMTKRELSNQIGHKSIKSTEHYGKD